MQGVRRESSAREDDIARSTDALAWNWLAAGTDGHAKNYSLLLQDTTVRLAPWYDLNSLLPYRAPGRLALAMRIGDAPTIGATGRSAWATFAQRSGQSPEQVLARVERMLELAPEAFRRAATDPLTADLGSDLPERLAEQSSSMTRVPAGHGVCRHRAALENRTPDLLITSETLYRLS